MLNKITLEDFNLSENGLDKKSFETISSFLELFQKHEWLRQTFINLILQVDECKELVHNEFSC